MIYSGFNLSSGRNFSKYVKKKNIFLNKTKYSSILTGAHPIRLQSTTVIPQYDYMRKSLTNLFSNEEDLQLFDSTFTDLVNFLTAGLECDKTLGRHGISERLRKALYYNIPKGKKKRGLTVLVNYKMLEKPDLLTKENIYKACVLGWTVELLQGYLLIIDDIMDKSETRRGQICWHRLENVGMRAINDALFIEQSIYKILKKYFADHKCYMDMFHTIHDINLCTIYGQMVDTSNILIDNFSMERYNTIIKYKTSYYTFVLPFKLAMFLANETDETVHSKSMDILFKVGNFFQVQDDYLDCFGDPNKTGKIGTDIESNKCSWLINKALEVADPEQRKMLINNYGINDPKCVETVKKIYLDLNIPQHYVSFEENMYNMIMSDIKNSSHIIKEEIFKKITSVLFKREC